MTEKKTRKQYGLWESPISAASLAAGTRLSDVAWGGTSGRDLVWLEGRSAHGVLVALDDGDRAARDLTGDRSIRAEVGYGGGDFGVHGDSVYFVAHREGRIYRQSLREGEARPITPGAGKAAAPTVSPDGQWVVFVHHDEEGLDRLGVVDSEGRHWPQILTQGHDFYMQPSWSPDGRQLAWIAWDHPRMPWDGTWLYVATVDRDTSGLPRLGEARRLAGGEDVAIFQPRFAVDGNAVYCVSDESGWGRLTRVDLEGGVTRTVTPEPAEHGLPAWVQGMRTFDLLSDGRHAVAVRSEGGFSRAHRIDLESSEATPLAGIDEYTDLSQPAVSPDGHAVAFLGSGPGTPPRLVVHELDASRTVVAARSLREMVPEHTLSRPEAVQWKTAGGETAYGILYPPSSDRFEGAGKPPLIALVHGGPTGQAQAGWSPQAQYFATRGYAVLYVNYRGSTGYGRDYMLRLREQWGVCDVEDVVSAVRFLADAGRIDRDRAVIMGGSAGGFTVLQTMVTEPDVFAAGVCLYGVSNQFTLASDTHKFEERYLDSLLGPLPEAAAVYRERSPVFHARRIRRPLAVFQGEIDQVVPRDQSDAIVDSLKASGVPHVYHVYEGEGHGWRKRETIEHFYGAVESFLREHVVFV